MPRKPTRKRFDCVAFKRQAQERIYAEIKGLSPADQIAYFQREAERGPLGAWWKQVKARQPARRVRAASARH